MDVRKIRKQALNSLGLILLCSAWIPTGAAEADLPLKGSEEMVAAYGNILWQYYDVWTTEGVDPGFYNDGIDIVNYLVYYSASDSANRLVFTFRDLDGNGTEELLIGMAYDESLDDAAVLDIFTYTDDHVVHLLDGGERWQLTVCEDGVVYENGSGGAAYNYQTYYAIGEDGMSCDQILYYAIDSISNTVELVDGTVVDFDGDYDKYANQYAPATLSWNLMDENRIAEQTTDRVSAGEPLTKFDVIEAPQFRNGVCADIYTVFLDYYSKMTGTVEYSGYYISQDYEEQDPEVDILYVVDMETGENRSTITVNLRTGEAVETQSSDGSVKSYNVFAVGELLDNRN